MSFWPRRSSTSKSASESRHTGHSPLTEAAEQTLDKASKLRTAEGAVLLRHLSEIAHDDVADVRRLKAKHLGPEFAAGETDVSDIIICDDYTHNPPPAAVPQSPGWMKAALAGTALAAAALGGSQLGALLNRPTVPSAPAPVNTRVESKEGFLIELVPTP